ncbi:hypothetical protein [Kocuria tytonicola]|uniref:hypothetical protein n=1 Tax=Kocuria tytonicola TaxID=2055946 RepID=UPI000F51CB72|nr:hypothetical protein [Kocuria tytonicola]
MKKIAALSVVVLLSAGSAACSHGDESQPDFASLDDAYGAVDSAVHCDENPPAPTEKVLDPPGPTGESRMCTNAVEVFWFESSSSQEKMFDMLSSIGKPGSPVEFATGRNWFVVDYSAAPNGATPDRDVDMENLAKKLDAHYISAGGE